MIEEIVRLVVFQALGSGVVAVGNITSGAIGRIFVVSTGQVERKLAVKLVKNEPEAPFERESSDERVYGARWSNLRAAHKVLVSNGVLVPRIHSIGEIEDGSLHYVIMDHLEGESVREYLADEQAAGIEQLHAVVGRAIGRLHAITRRYQGWADMTTPYSKAWKEAFFESLEGQLQQAAQKSGFIKEYLGSLERFARERYARWADPDGFVFSHTDGFQGIAKRENREWKFAGVVDVEDHQFTDQRFVLAGYELALNGDAPPVFWKAYQEYVGVPDSYVAHKGLFEMYYLLSWLTGCDAEVAEKFERAIYGILKRGR